MEPSVSSATCSGKRVATRPCDRRSVRGRRRLGHGRGGALRGGALGRAASSRERSSRPLRRALRRDGGRGARGHGGWRRRYRGLTRRRPAAAERVSYVLRGDGRGAGEEPGGGVLG